MSLTTLFVVGLVQYTLSASTAMPGAELSAGLAWNAYFGDVRSRASREPSGAHG